MMMTMRVTVYIDDLSIDDWSSILRSSILSVSTIYIDDPIQYGLFWFRWLIWGSKQWCRSELRILSSHIFGL